MPATSPPPNPFNRQTPGGAPPRQTPRPGPSFTRRWIWAILALLLVNVLIANLVPTGSSNRITIPYTQFKDEVQADNVTSITATADQIDGSTKKAISTSGSSTTSTDFHTVVPSFTSSTGAGGLAGDNLEQLLEAHHVQVTAQVPSQSVLLTLLLSFGPTILLIGGFILLSRAAARATGGAGIMGFGRSTARLYDAERPSTTFADVAGIDDAKEELVEVVDFLREPQKYQRLGGTVPKGVLLVGLPGTGKTLLARAVAGEARVPFFSISASEFVEAIVGVGAARVRDLFKQARENAPAIIFIDELDAIGRARGQMVIGGSSEQEQTLNQILTEMDGFSSREGIIVLAATNQPDVLDKALLRPGRFDRRVIVNLPDKNGREAILRVHTRTVPLAKELNLAEIAAATPGFSGADIKNLVNESALLAARRNQNEVRQKDFLDSLEKIILGPERPLLLSRADKERIAYHEGGHAILGLVVPGADPVNRVTIVPRGQALGMTYQRPDTERYNYPEDYLRGRIVGALGGRAAEEIVYAAKTTGAESDIEQATALARRMVTRWGMSDRVGLVELAPRENPYLSGFDGYGRQKPYSEATAEAIDAEVRRIIVESHEEARRLLIVHRKQLDALAAALVARETLNAEEILEVTGLKPAPSPQDGIVADDGRSGTARNGS